MMSFSKAHGRLRVVPVLFAAGFIAAATILLAPTSSRLPAQTNPAEFDETIGAYLTCIDFDCSDALNDVLALGPEAVPQLIMLLQSPPSQGVPVLPGDGHEIRLVVALGQFRDTRAIAALRPLLAHSNPVLRAQVVHALSQIGGTDVLDLLLPRLTDPDPLVRETTVASLLHLQDSQALPELRRALETETAPHVRRSIEEAIQALQ